MFGIDILTSLGDFRHKPEDEFTGQESYVHEKILARDVSFFPMNRSLELDRMESGAYVACVFAFNIVRHLIPNFTLEQSASRSYCH